MKRQPGMRRAIGRYNVMLRVANEYITCALRKHNVRSLRGDAIVIMAGKPYTRQELIRACMERKTDWLRDEADRRLAFVRDIRVKRIMDRIFAEVRS